MEVINKPRRANEALTVKLEIFVWVISVFSQVFVFEKRIFKCEIKSIRS